MGNACQVSDKNVQGTTTVLHLSPVRRTGLIFLVTQWVRRANG